MDRVLASYPFTVDAIRHAQTWHDRVGRFRWSLGVPPVAFMLVGGSLVVMWACAAHGLASTAARELATIRPMLQEGHHDSVLLFGSAARGDATHTSDLDVLIVRLTPHSERERVERCRNASELVRTPSWLRRQ